jgi:hypothetical protein
MRGTLAEALYLQANPDWAYVRSPLASQHDLYRWVDGRRAPSTAQIKTHASPDPTIYARDMVADHRSNLFVVPDDHVPGLRRYWQDQIHRDAGMAVSTVNAERQLRRVQGLGFKAQDLDDRL